MIKRHINILKLTGYFLVAPILVWNLAIGKSIGLWKECEKNEKELRALEVAANGENPDKLEISANGYLLDSIAEDRNIDIVKYDRFVTAAAADYSLATSVLVISGDYFKLLKAVNRLEETRAIHSLSFQTEMNYKTRQTTLTATIITQEVLKNQ